jgi:hypothetical protein
MKGIDLKRVRGEGINSLTDDQWSCIFVFKTLGDFFFMKTDELVNISSNLEKYK